MKKNREAQQVLASRKIRSRLVSLLDNSVALNGELSALEPLLYISQELLCI